MKVDGEKTILYCPLNKPNYALETGTPQHTKLYSLVHRYPACPRNMNDICGQCNCTIMKMGCAYVEE